MVAASVMGESATASETISPISEIDVISGMVLTDYSVTLPLRDMEAKFTIESRQVVKL